MELKELIDSIKPYFVTFNVLAEDGAQYVFVKFPKTWKLPNHESLNKEFNVQVGSDTNGIYFANEMANGIEPLFKTITYCINLNKNIEEKAKLFKIKINELQDLFANESLERLQKLEFVIKGKKIKKKEEEDASSEEKKIIKEEQVEVVELVVPKNKKKKNVEIESETSKNDDLLSLAQNLVGGVK